jgi:hypothetical protein
MLLYPSDKVAIVELHDDERLSTRRRSAHRGDNLWLVLVKTKGFVPMSVVTLSPQSRARLGLADLGCVRQGWDVCTRLSG